MIDTSKTIIELQTHTYPESNSTVYKFNCPEIESHTYKGLSAFAAVWVSSNGEIRHITNELPEENDLFTLACKFATELVPLLLRYNNPTQNTPQQFRL